MEDVSEGEPSPLFRSIACHELWGNWRSGREISNGALSATGNDICDGLGKTDPYDSAAWQSQSDIVYFQGPYDPTTTVAHVEYHFAEHPSVHRDLVTVPGASHAPLTLGLAGRGCSREVWLAILGDGALGDALTGCAGPGEEPVELQSSRPSR